MLLSICPSLSSPIPPSLGPQVCSLYLSLHCCPENRFINTIFLDSIYICVNIGYSFQFMLPGMRHSLWPAAALETGLDSGERAPPTAMLLNSSLCPSPKGLPLGRFRSRSFWELTRFQLGVERKGTYSHRPMLNYIKNPKSLARTFVTNIVMLLGRDNDWWKSFY